ncbi:MAG: FemAB family XrtA/PEP-CTERM system-associated protein [Halobacteriota archaeon]
MEIVELKQSEEKLWDDYVLQSDESTFFHQIGWKNVVEHTYGHKPIYLVAKEDGQIKGILPLFWLKSKIFGKKLVSVPFAPYGGVCAETKDVEDMLLEEAKKLAEEYDVDYLELRYLGRSSDNEVLFSNSRYTTFILNLNKNIDNLWDEKLNKKVRNAVRKAYKSNLECSLCSLKQFYDLYLKNMKLLGTPAHPCDFFSKLMKEFPDKSTIFGVEYNDKVVSSTILLSFKDTLISGWTASDKEYSNLNPNNLLYWEVIKYACEQGYSYFDFGRSLVDSGTYQFKKPWGGDIINLSYQYYGRKKIPDTSQTNPKRRKFASLWRKTPSPLANLLNPRLRGHFP